MIDLPAPDCCAGVETIYNEGVATELRHVIPDDDTEHVPELFYCPCLPELEWFESDLAVALHLDARAKASR